MKNISNVIYKYYTTNFIIITIFSSKYVILTIYLNVVNVTISSTEHY